MESLLLRRYDWTLPKHLLSYDWSPSAELRFDLLQLRPSNRRKLSVSPKDWSVCLRWRKDCGSFLVWRQVCGVWVRRSGLAVSAFLVQCRRAFLGCKGKIWTYSLSLYIYIYLGPGTTTFFWSFQTNTVVLSCSHFTHEKIGRIRFYMFLYGLHTACIRSWFEEYTVVSTKYGRGSKNIRSFPEIYGRIRSYTISQINCLICTVHDVIFELHHN